MKLTSYWLDTAEPAGDFRREPIPTQVDVAVVGAGFTGLSVVVTHEISFAREVADTLMLMDRGVVVERGDAREVLSAPREPRTKAFLERVL